MFDKAQASLKALFVFYADNLSPEINDTKKQTVIDHDLSTSLNTSGHNPAETPFPQHQPPPNTRTPPQPK